VEDLTRGNEGLIAGAGWLDEKQKAFLVVQLQRALRVGFRLFDSESGEGHGCLCLERYPHFSGAAPLCTP